MPVRVEISSLVVRRGGVPVLEVPRLTLEPGRVVALLGENGSGKTSLLRLLAGLDRDFGGDVRFDGMPLDRFYLPRARPDDVAFLPQDPLLFDRTVEANVVWGLRIKGMGREEAHRRARKSLDQMGAGHLASRRAWALSGGETRRVALARALVFDPGVLLLDEPFSGVDRDGVSSLEELVANLAAEGRVVVFSTHNRGQALRLAQDVVEVHAGRLVKVRGGNVLRGDARHEGGRFSFNTGRIELELLPWETPPSVVHIPPEDVVIGRERPEGSARNRFRGTVVAMEQVNGAAEVTVEAGEPIVARLTLASLAEQGVSLGGEVWVSFKSASVRTLAQ